MDSWKDAFICVTIVIVILIVILSALNFVMNLGYDQGCEFRGYASYEKIDGKFYCIRYVDKEIDIAPYTEVVKNE